MSKENEKTIEVYEEFGGKYLERNEEAIKNNPRAKKDDERRKELLKTYMEGLPRDAKIFEVGSAGGVDAIYLHSLGYNNITVSDVADYFLKRLESEGLTPERFNLRKDDFAAKYDFI